MLNFTRPDVTHIKTKKKNLHPPVPTKLCSMMERQHLPDVLEPAISWSVVRATDSLETSSSAHTDLKVERAADTIGSHFLSMTLQYLGV